MRKELIKLLVIIGFLFSMYQIADAQVMVRVKPVGPGKAVVKVKKPGKNHFWRKGHWQWKPGKKKYVWVKGSWIKHKKGKVWIDGRWKKVRGGFMWVPGHWRRR